MVNLAVKIGSIELQNPIMPASGTFSEDLERVYDLSLLGAHVTKTFTIEKRAGNSTPRVAEQGNSMLNSIGIPSKGIEHFKREIIPYYQNYDVPLVVSVSGRSEDEFADIVEQITVPGVDVIEVNISCPNMEEDGKVFAMRPSSAGRVMEKIRQATSLPIWAKLTPNTGETVEVARACEQAGADALVTANTMLSMSINLETFKPSLGNIMGGLSGKGLKPINLRMTYQCAKAVSIPVIGCGGISTANDVIEYMVAGATSVQVGTASFINPLAIPNIIGELKAELDSRSIPDVNHLIDAIHLGEEKEQDIFAEVPES